MFFIPLQIIGYIENVYIIYSIKFLLLNKSYVKIPKRCIRYANLRNRYDVHTGFILKFPKEKLNSYPYNISNNKVLNIYNITCYNNFTLLFVKSHKLSSNIVITLLELYHKKYFKRTY